MNMVMGMTAGVLLALGASSPATAAAAAEYAGAGAYDRDAAAAFVAPAAESQQGQGQDRKKQNAGSQGRGQQGQAGQAGQQNRGNQKEKPAGQQNRGNQAEPRGQGRDDRAQPRGQGRDNPGRAQGGRPDRPGEQGAARRRGNPGLSAAELRSRIGELPPDVRRMADSRRAGERMIVGAAARGVARGMQRDALDVRTANDRLHVRNRRGDVLLDLPEDRARELGAWQMRRLGDRPPQANAPSFCRSGEGHPVWGREWCLEKGFGLGGRSGTIWSRSRIDDVRYNRRGDREQVGRDILVDVLGDVVFGRLALHALSLGYTDPLAGTWVAADERNAPRVLRIHAGGVPLAEFVDVDRDDNVDLLFVAQPRR